MARLFSDYRAQLIVCDGEWRLELMARGWPGNVPIERAGMERPQIVRDVAEAFIDAGGKILTAPTADAHALGCLLESPEVLSTMNREMVRAIASAVSDASGSGCEVFGTIGPPRGLLLLEEFGEDELCEAYRAQAAELASAGVTAIICGGFTELEALRLCVMTAMESKLPIIGSMKFDSGETRMETTLGVTILQMCLMLKVAGAAGAGCDHSEDPDGAAKVVAAIREAWELPIWVRVDAGLPHLSDGNVVFPETPDTFAARLSDLRAGGANLVGGGHGASARHISALVAASKATPSSKGRRKTAGDDA